MSFIELSKMQGPTQRSFHELLQQLQKNNKRELTVLLLGEATQVNAAAIAKHV